MKPENKNSIKGFTLPEVLVVTAIISLILTLVMPNYLSARSKTLKLTCASNQKIIYTAAIMYENIEGKSLESLGHKERLNAIIEKGYLKGNQWCNCPSNSSGGHDDYTLIFDDEGYLVDVQCDVKPSEHVWP